MSKKHFLRGLRDGIPNGHGDFAVSCGIGISAHNAHLSILKSFLLSFLNIASSGEYGGITIIAADSGLWAMALMMLVVNARYLLMSCALSQRLSPDTPLPWRLLIAYDLTDEIFIVLVGNNTDFYFMRFLSFFYGIDFSIISVA